MGSLAGIDIAKVASLLRKARHSKRRRLSGIVAAASETGLLLQAFVYKNIYI